MNFKNLYETIFKRKSVRKLDLTPLDDATLNKIAGSISELEPMYKDIKVEMKIIPQKEISNLFTIKAPHYIIVSSENKDGYLTNAGFMLQQMDLLLSSMGIGCCWLGMAKPAKEIVSGSQLDFVIALAFGMPLEPLHRQGISDFKRKPISKISNCNEDNKMIASALLAPSGVNSQPWYFEVKENEIHAYCVKSNIIKAVIFEKLNKIDMGVAICHIWVTSKYFGKDVNFIFDIEAQNNSPKGYYYIATIKNI